MARELTDKQKRFVEEYLIDLNATQAAIRAGYSARTAGKIGHELLEKTRIKEAVDTEIAKRSRRTGVTQDRVIRELAKIAFANAADIIDLDTAEIKKGAAREDTAAIQSVRKKESAGENSSMVEREVRLYDKKAALELLGKHLGMFREQVDMTVEHSQKLDDILSQLGGKGLDE